MNGARAPVLTMPITGWITSKKAASWQEAKTSLTVS